MLFFNNPFNVVGRLELSSSNDDRYISRENIMLISIKNIRIYKEPQKPCGEIFQRHSLDRVCDRKYNHVVIHLALRSKRKIK